jgi:MEMO1 family protein
VKPKLREVEAHPIRHQGQALVLLRDPLHLSQTSLAVPQPLGPLLALMDGSRDEPALEAALLLRAGVRLAPGLLSKLVADLDEALLLDNERFAAAREEALRAYRQAPFRVMSAAEGELADRPDLWSERLQSYLDDLPPAPTPGSRDAVRGLVSPHIDYQRGGPVYASAWRGATGAAQEAELVILFGTDHQGRYGSLTLTRQSYATPWGVLPTDLEVVDALAAALGEAEAYGEELHHRGEHSIELAANWLHFVRQGAPVAVVPILCGSFARFVAGELDPARYDPFAQVVARLREVMAARSTLVVAAADLAHVGPAFGDGQGLDFIGRAQLRSADERLLQAVYEGDADGFFRQIRDEGDRRHVCGLPPIYLTLRLLGEVRGEPAGYELCPADPQGMSFVSVAGVILRQGAGGAA